MCTNIFHRHLTCHTGEHRQAGTRCARRTHHRRAADSPSRHHAPIIPHIRRQHETRKTRTTTNSVRRQAHNPISSNRHAHYNCKTMYTNKFHNNHCATTYFKTRQNQHPTAPPPPIPAGPQSPHAASRLPDPEVKTAVEMQGRSADQLRLREVYARPYRYRAACVHGPAPRGCSATGGGNGRVARRHRAAPAGSCAGAARHAPPQQ